MKWSQLFRAQFDGPRYRSYQFASSNSGRLEHMQCSFRAELVEWWHWRRRYLLEGRLSLGLYWFDMHFLFGSLESTNNLAHFRRNQYCRCIHPIRIPSDSSLFIRVTTFLTTTSSGDFVNNPGRRNGVDELIFANSCIEGKTTRKVEWFINALKLKTSSVV